jgi:hypothetical protein
MDFSSYCNDVEAFLVREGDMNMTWIPIYESEQIMVVVDDENKNVIFEVNSGGYRPKYVTVHYSKEGLEELISALINAKEALKKETS